MLNCGKWPSSAQLVLVQNPTVESTLLLRFGDVRIKFSQVSVGDVVSNL